MNRRDFVKKCGIATAMSTVPIAALASPIIIPAARPKPPCWPLSKELLRKLKEEFLKDILEDVKYSPCIRRELSKIHHPIMSNRLYDHFISDYSVWHKKCERERRWDIIGRELEILRNRVKAKLLRLEWETVLKTAFIPPTTTPAFTPVVSANYPKDISSILSMSHVTKPVIRLDYHTTELVREWYPGSLDKAFYFTIDERARPIVTISQHYSFSIWEGLKSVHSDFHKNMRRVFGGIACSLKQNIPVSDSRIFWATKKLKIGK